MVNYGEGSGVKAVEGGSDGRDLTGAFTFSLSSPSAPPPSTDSPARSLGAGAAGEPSERLCPWLGRGPGSTGTSTRNAPPACSQNQESHEVI